MMMIYPLDPDHFPAWLEREDEAIRAAGGRFEAVRDIEDTYTAMGVFGAVRRCMEGVEEALIGMALMPAGSMAQDLMRRSMTGWTVLAADLLSTLEGL